MQPGAGLPFTWVYNVSGTTATVAVVSLYSNDVDVTLNGDSQTLSMTGRGTDGLGSGDSSNGGTDPAAYSAKHTFTVAKDTNYPLVVTQNAITRTGVVKSERSGNFKFGVFACYFPGNSSQPQSSKPGCSRYLLNEDIDLLLGIEDNGYEDSMVIDDTGRGGSGRYTLGQVHQDGTAYARVLGFCAYLGLFHTDESDSGYTRFNDPSFVRLRENTASKWGDGDHGFAYNNPEEDSTPDTSVIANGVQAFEETLGLAMPFIDTLNSAAWVEKYNNIEFIDYDRVSGITVQCYRNDANQDAVNQPNNRMLGTAQIADIKGAVTGTSDYTILLMSTGSYFQMPFSERVDAYAGTDYTGEAWTNSAWMGAQQPLHGYTNQNSDGISGTSEWDELIRDNTDGIAKKAADGNSTLLGYHGDTHYTKEQQLTFSSTGSLVALDMKVFSCGTFNARTAQYLHPTVVSGYDNGGVEHIWNTDAVVRSPALDQSYENTCIVGRMSSGVLYTDFIRVTNSDTGEYEIMRTVK